MILLKSALLLACVCACSAAQGSTARRTLLQASLTSEMLKPLIEKKRDLIQADIPSCDRSFLLASPSPAPPLPTG